MSLSEFRKNIWTRLITFPLIFFLLMGDVARASPSHLAPSTNFERRSSAKVEGRAGDSASSFSLAPGILNLYKLIKMTAVGKSSARLTWGALLRAEKRLRELLIDSETAISYGNQEIVFQRSKYKLVFYDPVSVKCRIEFNTRGPSLAQTPDAYVWTGAKKVAGWLALPFAPVLLVLRFTVKTLVLAPILALGVSLGIAAFQVNIPSIPSSNKASLQQTQPESSAFGKILEPYRKMFQELMHGKTNELAPLPEIPADHLLVVDEKGEIHLSPGSSVRQAPRTLPLSPLEEAADRLFKKPDQMRDALLGGRARETTTLPGVSRKAGTWLNQPGLQNVEYSDVQWKLDDFKNEQDVFAYVRAMKEYGYTRVFIGIPRNPQKGPLGSAFSYYERLRTLVEAANKAGIRVTPIAGDRHWAKPFSTEAQSIVRWLFETGLEIDGVALDIEWWITNEGTPEEMNNLKMKLRDIAGSRKIYWFTLPGQSTTEGVHTMLAAYATDYNKIKKLILEHQRNATSDFTVFLDASRQGHEESASTSFYGRQQEIPGLLQRLLADSDLNLRADRRFKGIGIHRGAGSTIEELAASNAQEEGPLADIERQLLPTAAPNLGEYVEPGQESLSPYGSEPPTRTQRAKRFFVDRVKAIAKSFFALYKSLAKTGENLSKGAPLSADNDALVLGSLGHIVAGAKGMSTIIQPRAGDPHIQGLRLTLTDKKTGQRVKEVDFMHMQEPLRLSLPKGMSLNDIEAVLEISMLGGANSVSPYLQVDIGNIHDIDAREPLTTGEFLLANGQSKTIAVKLPAAAFGEGANMFSVKLVQEERIVSQIGGYDVLELRKMLLRNAADFTATARDAGTKGPNKLGLRGSELGLSMTVDSARLFYVDADPGKGLDLTLLSALRQSGVQCVTLNASELSPQHFQGLVHAAAQSGIKIVLLANLQSPLQQAMSTPPVVEGVLPEAHRVVLAPAPVEKPLETPREMTPTAPAVKQKPVQPAAKPVASAYNPVLKTLTVGDRTFNNVAVNAWGALGSEIFSDLYSGAPIAVRDTFGNVMFYKRSADSAQVFHTPFEKAGPVFAAMTRDRGVDHVIYQFPTRRVTYYPARKGLPERTVITFRGREGQGSNAFASVEFAGDKRKLGVVGVLEARYSGDSVVPTHYDPAFHVFDAAGNKKGVLASGDFPKLGKVLSYCEYDPRVTGPSAGRPFFERDSEGHEWSYLYASRPSDPEGRVSAVIRLRANVRNIMSRAEAVALDGGGIEIRVGDDTLVLRNDETQGPLSIAGIKIAYARVERYGAHGQEGAATQAARLEKSGFETYSYRTDAAGNKVRVAKGPRSIRESDADGNILFSSNLEGAQKSFYKYTRTADGGWMVEERAGSLNGPVRRTIWKDAAGNVFASLEADGLRRAVEEEKASNGGVKKRRQTDDFKRETITEFYVGGHEDGLPSRITGHGKTVSLRYEFDSASGRLIREFHTDQEGLTKTFVLHTSGPFVGFPKSATAPGMLPESYSYELDAFGFVKTKSVENEKEILTFDALGNMVSRIGKAGDGKRFYKTTPLANGGRQVEEYVVTEKGDTRRVFLREYDKDDKEVALKGEYDFDEGYVVQTHKAGKLEGLPEIKVDRFGNVIVYEHVLDENGRLTRTVSFPQDDPEKKSEKKTIEEISAVSDLAAGRLMGKPYRSTDPRGVVSEITYQTYQQDGSVGISAKIVRTGDQECTYDAFGNQIARRDIASNRNFRLRQARLQDGGRVVDEFLLIGEKGQAQERFVRQLRYDAYGNLRVLIDARNPSEPRLFFPLLNAQGKKVQEMCITAGKLNTDQWREFLQRKLRLAEQEGRVRLLDDAAGGKEISPAELAETVGQLEVIAYYVAGRFEGKVEQRIPQNDALQSVSYHYELDSNGQVLKEIQVSATTQKAKTIEFKDGIVVSIEDHVGKRVFEVLERLPNGYQIVKMSRADMPSQRPVIAVYDVTDTMYQHPLETTDVNTQITSELDRLEDQGIQNSVAFDGREIMRWILLGRSFESLTQGEKEEAMVSYVRVLNHFPEDLVVIEPDIFHAVKGYQCTKGPLVVAMAGAVGDDTDAFAKRIVELLAALGKHKGTYQIALQDPDLSAEQLLRLTESVRDLTSNRHSRFESSNGQFVHFNSQDSAPKVILLGGTQLECTQDAKGELRVETKIETAKQSYAIRETPDGILMIDNGTKQEHRLAPGQSLSINGMTFKATESRQVEISFNGESGTLAFMDPDERFPGFQGLAITPLKGSLRMESVPMPASEDFVQAARGFSASQIQDALDKKPQDRTALEEMILRHLGIFSSPRVDVGAQHAALESPGYLEFYVPPGSAAEGATAEIPVRVLSRTGDFGRYTIHWYIESMDSSGAATKCYYPINLQGDGAAQIALVLKGLKPGSYRITGRISPDEALSQEKSGFMQCEGPGGSSTVDLSNSGPNQVSFNNMNFNVTGKDGAWVFESGGDSITFARQPAIAVKGDAYRPMSAAGFTRKMGLVKKAQVGFAQTPDGLPYLNIDGTPVTFMHHLDGTVTLWAGSKAYTLNMNAPRMEASVGNGNHLMAEWLADGSIRLWINGENALLHPSLMTVQEGNGPARAMQPGQPNSVKIANETMQAAALRQDFSLHAGEKGFGDIDEGGLKVPLQGQQEQLLLRRAGNDLLFVTLGKTWAFKRVNNQWIYLTNNTQSVLGTSPVSLGQDVEAYLSDAGILHIRVGKDIFQVGSRAGGEIQLQGNEGRATLYSATERTGFVRLRLAVRPAKEKESTPAATAVKKGPPAPVVVVPQEAGPPQEARWWISALGWLGILWLMARLGDLYRLARENRRVAVILQSLEDRRKRFPSAISSRRSLREFLVKKAWVFFGGRRVVPIEEVRQHEHVIRYSELFDQAFVVMGGYARKFLGITEPEKLQFPSWRQRVWSRIKSRFSLPESSRETLRAFSKLRLRLSDIGLELSAEQMAQLEEMLVSMRKSGLNGPSLEKLSEQFADELANKLEAAHQVVLAGRAAELTKAGVIEGRDPTGTDISDLSPFGQRVLQLFGRKTPEDLMATEIDAIASAAEQLRALEKANADFKAADFPDDQLKLLLKYHLLDASKGNDLFSLDLDAEVMGRGSVNETYQRLRQDERLWLLNPAILPVANMRDFFHGASVSQGLMRAVALTSQLTEYGVSMTWRAIRATNPKSNTEVTLLFAVKSEAEKDVWKFKIINDRWVKGQMSVLEGETKANKVHMDEAFTEPVRLRRNFRGYADLMRARAAGEGSVSGLPISNAAPFVAAALAYQQSHNMIYTDDLSEITGISYVGNWSEPGLQHYRNQLGKDAQNGQIHEDLNICVVNSDKGLTFILPAGDVFLLELKEGENSKLGRVGKGAKIAPMVAMLLDHFGFQPYVRRATPEEEQAGKGSWITDYRKVDLVKQEVPEIVAAADEYAQLKAAQANAAQAFMDQAVAATCVVQDRCGPVSAGVTLGSKAGLDPRSGLTRLFGKISLSGIKADLLGPISLSFYKPLADTHLASAVYAYFSPEGIVQETAKHIKEERAPFEGSEPAELSQKEENEIDMIASLLPAAAKKEWAAVTYWQRLEWLANYIGAGYHLEESQRVESNSQMQRAKRLSDHLHLKAQQQQKPLDELKALLQGADLVFANAPDKIRCANFLGDALSDHGIFLRAQIPAEEYEEIALRHMAKGPFLEIAEMLVDWELAAMRHKRGGRPIPGKTAQQRETNSLMQYGNALIKAKKCLDALAQGLADGRLVLAAKSQGIEVLDPEALGRAFATCARSLGVLERPVLIDNKIISENVAYRLALLSEREGEYRAVGHQVANLLYHGSLDPEVFKAGDNSFGREGILRLRRANAIFDPEGYDQSKDWSWNSLKAAMEQGQQLGSEIYSDLPPAMEETKKTVIAKFLQEARNRGLFVQELIFPDADMQRMVIVARFPEARKFCRDYAARMDEIKSVFKAIGESSGYDETKIQVLTPGELDVIRSPSGLNVMGSALEERLAEARSFLSKARSPDAVELWLKSLQDPFTKTLALALLAKVPVFQDADGIRRASETLHYSQAGLDQRIVHRVSPLDAYLTSSDEDTFHHYAMSASDVQVSVDDLNEFLRKAGAEISAQMVFRIKTIADNPDRQKAKVDLEMMAGQINAFLAAGAKAQNVPADRYRRVDAQDLLTLADLSENQEIPFVNRPLELFRRANTWTQANVSPWLQKTAAAGLLIFFTVSSSAYSAMALLGVMTLDLLLREKFLNEWAPKSKWTAWIVTLDQWLGSHRILGMFVNLAWIYAYTKFILAPIVMALPLTIVPSFAILFFAGSAYLLITAALGSVFDTFFFASKSLVLSALTLGHGEWVQKKFRSWVHSEKIKALAKIHGVDPEALYGLWDSAGWSLALGVPFAPDRLFGRVKVLERGGKMFEDAPIPLLIALLQLNEPPASAVLSGFNLLPTRATRLARAFGDDTSTFYGYANPDALPNWNAALMIVLEALANIMEARFYDASLGRAAQFAKARGILDFALPRMSRHPLYGEFLSPYQEFFRNVFSMKALREDQVSSGSESLGVGFFQYLLTACTAGDRSLKGKGPFALGVPEAINMYLELLQLDLHGGRQIHLDEAGANGALIPIASGDNVRVNYNAAERTFVLSIGARQIRIEVGPNPDVDPIRVRDNDQTSYAPDPFSGVFSVHSDIRIKQTGLGTISLQIGNRFYELGLGPEEKGAVLIKPGRIFKAARVLQLLHGSLSEFAGVDYVLAQGVGLSLNSKEEDQLDEQIARLTRLLEARERAKVRAVRWNPSNPSERPALLADLDAMAQTAHRDDALALDFLQTEIATMAARLGDAAVIEKVKDVAALFEHRIKEGVLKDHFYADEQTWSSPVAWQWLEKSHADLLAHATRFEAFRQEYRPGDLNPSPNPRFQDVTGLDETIKDRIKFHVTNGEAKWLPVLRKLGGEELYGQALREIKAEETRATSMGLLAAFMPSGLLAVLPPAYVLGVWMLSASPGLTLAAVTVSCSVAVYKLYAERKAYAVRIKATLPRVAPAGISIHDIWETAA